jgi:uncharacterized protein (DUF2344 family)
MSAFYLIIIQIKDKLSNTDWQIWNKPLVCQDLLFKENVWKGGKEKNLNLLANRKIKTAV